MSNLGSRSDGLIYHGISFLMCKELSLFSLRPASETDGGSAWGWRGTQGQGSNSKERRSTEECVSVQIRSPAGLPEINDVGLTHCFILSMALFFEFCFLTLWKHST